MSIPLTSINTNPCLCLTAEAFGKKEKERKAKDQLRRQKRDGTRKLKQTPKQVTH